MADRVITQQGLERLERELRELRDEGRRRIAERLREALDVPGELMENAEYLEAKEEQARLEQRIALLEQRIESAHVHPGGPNGGAVSIGSRVRVRDRDTRQVDEYEIVGSGEGDPVEGRISAESPIGRALLGRRAGDVVEAEAPAGLRRLTLVSVHE